jgi:hypothetical protein
MFRGGNEIPKRAPEELASLRRLLKVFYRANFRNTFPELT